MGCNYLVVDLRNGSGLVNAPVHAPACVVIGLGTPSDATDVVLTDEQQLETLTSTIDAQPMAAATLVQLLRHNEHNDVTSGLFAESLAYSTLQQSSGFQH